MYLNIYLVNYAATPIQKIIGFEASLLAIKVTGRNFFENNLRDVRLI
jgi:hypothetical protein